MKMVTARPKMPLMMLILLYAYCEAMSAIIIVFKTYYSRHKLKTASNVWYDHHGSEEGHQNENCGCRLQLTKNGLKNTSDTTDNSFTAMRLSKTFWTTGQTYSVNINGKVPTNPKMKKSGCKKKAMVNAQVPIKPHSCVEKNMRRFAKCCDTHRAPEIQ